MNDKYRWHDLLANPEELPPDDNVVLVYDGIDYGIARYRNYDGFIVWIADYRIDTEEIIAWRYFEPFGGDLP